RRTTSTGQTVQQGSTAACRQRDGTSATPRGPTPRHRQRRPRCSCPERSDAKTRAPHGAPGSADPATASPGEAPCPPTAAVAPPTTSIIERCCDDHLNPPC